METYTKDEAATAPHGHVRFAETDIEVVAYRVSATDLCILLNKGARCVYRATIVGALDPKLEPHDHPLINENFVIRDLGAVQAELRRRLGR